MSRYSFILLIFLCASAAIPATSVSRWFSASYHDLRVTLRRYGHCVGDLAPLRDQNRTEAEYLISKMREFLDEGSYDNEQLANVSALMDEICRSDVKSYPISVNIDVNKYNHTVARCRAMDEVMDAMYSVFKRASFNKSEPLDFSTIQFYPNPTNKALSYNLTDLINTSWIKSEMILESVCNITDSVKEYVRARVSNSIAQDRSQQQTAGVFSNFMDLIDRILDPIIGFERRLYWEGSNRLELAYSGISNQFSNFRGAVGSRYRNIVNRFSSSSNSTVAANSTNLSTVPLDWPAASSSNLTTSSNNSKNLTVDKQRSVV